jgi:hypothetical protein
MEAAEVMSMRPEGDEDVTPVRRFVIIAAASADGDAADGSRI